MARPGSPTRDSRPRRDDAGGVWIVTGIVLGVLVYAGIVVTVMAGFTVALPLVVIPPVVVGLIGASNLLNGGRNPHARPGPRPPGPDEPLGPA
jgi:hypothetical protein